MKILRIILIVLIALVLVIAGISVYVVTNARGILVSQLETRLGVKIQLSSLKVRLPDTITAEGLVISDTLKVKRLVVTPSIVGFLRGDIGFNALLLEEPQVTVTRNADNTFDFGLPALKAALATQEPQKAPEPVAPSQAPKQEAPNVYVNKLVIRNAIVTFIDKGLVGSAPFVIKCSSLDLDVFRPSFLDFFRMQFNGAGRLLSQDENEVGAVSFSGWADIARRDMDAGLTLESGRIVHFAPYYKPYFKRDLASGDVAVRVDAKSKDNALTADVHITLANVGFKQPVGTPEASGEPEADLENFGFLVFDSLLSSEGGIDIDFTVRTKMDAPKFENVSFKGNFFQNRIKATFSKPPQQTVEDFKKVGEQFEAIGKEFKKIFQKD